MEPEPPRGTRAKVEQRSASQTLQPTELQPQAEARKAISEAAARGYVSSGEKRRRRARKAGLASGRARRALARGRKVPHRRDRTIALALSYEVRQVKRERFDALYAATCPRWGVPVDRRGLNTAYALYRAEMASYRACGQDFQTTNGQRSAALANRGRPRCPRQVQRVRRRLVDMGLVRYFHVRRGGAEPGNRDSLRVCLLPVPRNANVTPPTGAQAGPLRGPSACALPPAAEGIAPALPAVKEGPAPPGLSAPPTAAEPTPAEAGGKGSDEEIDQRVPAWAQDPSRRAALLAARAELADWRADKGSRG